MTVKYLNKTNVNLPMAIWLLNDTYYYIKEKNYISVTSLLKPIRELVLVDRHKDKDIVTEIEISALAKARDGQAIHDSIENAWSDKHAVMKACKLLGISEKVANSLVINPTSDEVTNARKQNKLFTPVYMEKRTVKKIGGFKLGGKFDLVLAGDLHDYKKTGTFTYISQSNASKYILQGSMYRWLNPDIILNDTLTINYYFTDWMEFKVSNPKYPPHQIMSQHFNLMSYEATERYISQKLKILDKFINHDVVTPLPLCTDKELWKDPTIYKYYSNPTSVRATKNFDTDSQAAYTYQRMKKKGIVKGIPGEAKACNYCSALPFCDQAIHLVKTKQLVLK